MKCEKYIYLQVSEKVMLDIFAGKYYPGDKIPSVRQLAEKFLVDKNTMQKALFELERIGLIYSVYTKGRFITENNAIFCQVRDEIIKKMTENLLKQLNRLGYKAKETITIIQEVGNSFSNI